MNWLTLGFTYSAMYMGRYNLSFANASLSKAFGWDKTQVGTIISSALLIYGLSAMFNGPISDRASVVMPAVAPFLFGSVLVQAGANQDGFNGTVVGETINVSNVGVYFAGLFKNTGDGFEKDHARRNNL